ncbi:MAG: hypothetical protein J6Z04_00150 [Clostridia bacterium]|nr:hypothetical protein [Clostridia bacterium]
MSTRKTAKTKQSGFLPFLPLIGTLPSVVLAILSLLLPFAVLVSKNPYTGEIGREARTLSQWGRLHDAVREIGGEGFAFFSAARGLAWTVAVATGLLLLLLILSRFVTRSRELNWTIAGVGVLLALASVIFFVFAVLFTVSAGGEETRVLLSAAPYCTLFGGTCLGVVSFFTVRRAL